MWLSGQRDKTVFVGRVVRKTNVRHNLPQNLLIYIYFNTAIVVKHNTKLLVISIVLSGLNCHKNPNQLKHCPWSLSLFSTGRKQWGLGLTAQHKLGTAQPQLVQILSHKTKIVFFPKAGWMSSSLYTYLAKRERDIQKHAGVIGRERGCLRPGWACLPSSCHAKYHIYCRPGGQKARIPNGIWNMVSRGQNR